MTTRTLYCGVMVLSASTLVTDPVSAQTRLSRPVIDTLHGGIVRVMNPGPTAWTGTNGWKLVLERTVQPGEGSDGALINPTSLTLLIDGRMIVRDEPQGAGTRLRLYDKSGQYVRDLGRPGEGPGEYRDPAFAIYRDTVLWQDMKLARMGVMTLTGTSVREVPDRICCLGGAQVSVTAEGNLRVPAFKPKSSGNQWIVFARNGMRVDSIPIPVAGTPRQWSFTVTGGSGTYGIPFSGYNLYGFGPNGLIVYGISDRYVLMLSRTGRDTTRIFGRLGVAGIPIPTGLRDSLFNQMAHIPELKDVAKLSDVPTVFPLWFAAAFDGSGNIWISRGTTRYQVPISYDVFSSDGRFLGAVTPPFTSATATSFAGDRVAVLDTDDNDLPRVRVYRIVRR